MWLFSWIRGIWRRRLSDASVLSRYRRAGASFGDAVSYIYMGECIGFAKLHAAWAEWEKEAAVRGYRTFSVDDFADLGGWGRAIEGFGAKRGPDEPPILHSERYRVAYLGKIKPVINLLSPVPQCGVYCLPSTKDPEPLHAPYRGTSAH